MVCIARFSGGGWFVGVVKDWEKAVLTAPRIYMYDKSSHGVMDIPGKPDEISLKRADFYFPTTDKAIIDLYTQSTSSIEVVGGFNS